MNGQSGGHESVFIQPRLIPGSRPGDTPVRLREEIHERALEAAKEVLRAHRSEVRRSK